MFAADFPCGPLWNYVFSYREYVVLLCVVSTKQITFVVVSLYRHLNIELIIRKTFVAYGFSKTV